MAAADKEYIDYLVTVSGLNQAQAMADDASRSADQASLALTGARQSASRTLPMMLMSVRSVNAARLAVEQTSKAFLELDPRAAMYGFLNMIQVVRNLTALMTMLKTSTGAASAAQAILAVLTGRWWIIPLALAAGAVVYSKIKSMQMGGLVPETGPYLLHKGEEVLPIHRSYTRREYVSPRTVQSFGPIFITFEKQPREGLDVDAWVRSLGPRLFEEARRG
ncbi:hypothetical protein ISS40_01090 [Candidatus Bathyarchaeota archaeon]|nr:hypothetical protein [Candidatus Bathyarchaeota archaeon]